MSTLLKHKVTTKKKNISVTFILSKLRIWKPDTHTYTYHIQKLVINYLILDIKNYSTNVTYFLRRDVHAIVVPYLDWRLALSHNPLKPTLE